MKRYKVKIDRYFADYPYMIWDTEQGYCVDATNDKALATRTVKAMNAKDTTMIGDELL